MRKLNNKLYSLSSKETDFLIIFGSFLFAFVIFFLRVLDKNPEEPILLLLIFPIATLSARFGAQIGVLFATLATVLLIFWYSYLSPVDLTTVGYLSRICAFYLVGLWLGQYSSKLKEQNYLMSAIMRSTDDSIYVKDKNHRYQFINEATEKRFGRTRTEIKGKTVADFFPKNADQANFIEDKVMESRESVINEVTVNTGGEQSTFLQLIGPLENSREEVVGTYCVSRDITDRKRYEKALKQAAQHFTVSRDLIGIASFKGYFLDVNPTFTKVLGYSEEELKCTPFLQFIHPDDQDQSLKEFEKAKNSRGTNLFRNRVKTKDGDYLWLEWTSITMPEENRFYVAIRDVTEIREAEQLKDEFFALVSHELRTPLTSIIGYLELLNEKEEQNPFLQVIDKNAKRLLRLVGDLLFVARLEAGHEVQIDKKDALIKSIADDSFNSFKLKMKEKNIDFVYESNIREDLSIKADQERIGQVLDNLLSNAHKFTPKEGKVVLRAYEKEGEVVIEVEDSGPGMTEKDQERAFEKFFRSESTKYQVSGVGLGLSICYKIIEMHDGSIKISSTPGQGSTFAVSLKV